MKFTVMLQDLFYFSPNVVVIVFVVPMLAEA
jgi:hypothetical protein